MHHHGDEFEVEGEVHFHTEVVDGALYQEPSAELACFPLPPPTEQEAARLLATIHEHIVRLLRRGGHSVASRFGLVDHD